MSAGSLVAGWPMQHFSAKVKYVEKYVFDEVCGKMHDPTTINLLFIFFCFCFVYFGGIGQVHSLPFINLSSKPTNHH